MARIRSVHPGILTDEDWVSVSPAARWLGLGLMMEADDQGIFEWKPVQIKVRILPGDNADVVALLGELEQANIVKKFEHGGRLFGVLRNFMRFQRPKRLKITHHLPPELAQFAGLTAEMADSEGDEQEECPPDDENNSSSGGQMADSEAIKPHPSPPKSRFSPQREEGGGRMEDGNKGESPPDPLSVDAVVKSWNLLAADTGLASVQRLTEPRARAVTARLSEIGGLEGWYALCDKIRASPFLLGRNGNAWKATFDWVLKPSNLTKIMEGNYDEPRGGNGGGNLATILESVR